MNESNYENPTNAATERRGAMPDEPCCTRTNALLCALGVGLAIGLIVRALRPDPTPTQRITHLLADLEDRLRDATRPALRKASAYASDGAEVLRDGLNGGEARLQRLVREATRGARRLFS